MSLDAERNGDDSAGVSTLQDYLGSEDPQFDRLNNKLDLTDALTSLEKREKTIEEIVARINKQEGKRNGLKQNLKRSRR